MKRIHAILAFSLLFSACKKGDGDSSTDYNGFKVDGVVFRLDSIGHHPDSVMRLITIYSKDNGGGTVIFHFGFTPNPTADGVYKYKLKALIQDLNDVNASFLPDVGASRSYDIAEGVDGPMTVTISEGKWRIQAPPITIEGSSRKTLEIQAHE